MFRQSEAKPRRLDGWKRREICLFWRGLSELLPSATGHVLQMSYFNYPQYSCTSRAIRVTSPSHRDR